MKHHRFFCTCKPCQHENAKAVICCRLTRYAANPSLTSDSQILIQTEETASLIQLDKNVLI
jgi:hypothetical protein